MNKNPPHTSALAVSFLGAGLLFCCVSIHTFAQSFGVKPEEMLKEHQRVAEQFKAGGANAPIFLITDCCSTSCRVDKSGKIRYAHTFISNFLNDSVLAETNRGPLVNTMNQLPAPPQDLPILQNQILVSGVRSNRWYYGVYNKTNLPTELHKIFKLVGHDGMFGLFR